MKVLCVFGKHQYGESVRGLSTEYSCFLPAFRNLGCKVIHFDSWNKTLYKDYADVNRRLLELVFEQKPNILFCVQMNYEIWTETLDIIKNETKTISICWTTDDSWKYEQFSRFIGKYYDSMTTTYVDVMPKYQSRNIRAYLTQWAASQNFLTEPLPSKQCTYPVSFVGMAYGDRKKIVQYLSNQGVNIHCFGYGWNNGSVEDSEMREIIQKSIISLNFAKAPNGSHQIKARTFEIPGYGGFLLTEYSKGLEDWYDIGTEIDTFSSPEELVEKINFYLKNPQLRNLIAKQGFKKTAHYHTYEKRLNEILSYVFKEIKKHPQNYNISDCMLRLDEPIKNYRRLTPYLQLLKWLLLFFCSIIFGKKNAPKVSRRILFELSWRFLGEKTFSASGLPGRLFPIV